MNTVRIMRNDNSASDETKEQELARNIKECTKIFNDLLEDCVRHNVSVSFSIVPKNHTKQNVKISLNSITKNLLT